MKVSRVLILLVLLQALLTTVHHLYGEFALYKDGVRLHIVMAVPLALLLTFAPLWIHRNEFGLRMFTAWTVLFWVLGIGLYEGLWNHLVLDILVLFNLNEKLSWAFVRSIPGDLVFEITGIAQFLVGCGVFYSIFRQVHIDRQCKKYA